MLKNWVCYTVVCGQEPFKQQALSEHQVFLWKALGTAAIKYS